MTAGSANNNTVTINASGADVTTDSSVIGGYSAAGTATANSNRVELTAADGHTVTVGRDVNGGFADSPNGVSDGNEVTLKGAVTVTQDVLGGETDTGGQANNNTVNLYEGVVIGRNLYGGWITSGVTTEDVTTGNALNLYGKVNVTGDTGYFQKWNFDVPVDFETNKDVMLTAGGTVVIPNNADVAVKIAGARPLMQNGDKVYLIKAGTLTAPSYNNTIDAVQGVTLDYKMLMKDSATQLWVEVDGEPAIAEQAKAVPEGRAANIATLAAGGDLFAENAMRNAFAAPANELNSYTFGALGFNRSSYDTGSSVDSDTFSVLAGLAKRRASETGAFTFGGFIEAGWGSYDTYNSFTSAGDVHGDGDTNYYGLGLSFRWDGIGTERGHFYSDAAIRYGKAENDSKTGLIDASGALATYKTGSPYYGGHFGVGYVKNLDAGANLDMYTRVLWTHLESDSVTLSSGDPVNFDDADSVRWRAGLRYAAKPNGAGRFYVGAAYEHEFGGDANAAAYGYAIGAPSLEGGTGIGEIGYLYKKSDSPFSADFNLSGFGGQRDGFGARVDLNWVF
jgi:hypothetical protein